ncbi:MAG TPA: protein-glutamate O-methyltransferase CheR [Allosphingosinicella sp.]|jgi:chemotaxis protein methyltransferase CheR|nr:protein-glutamate O-methyltransferase CheR [Allosphingosinicella sp.]
MQVSDASSRILAGLLEARTGQQLTMSRRWRIETALSPLMRERDIGSLDSLVAALVARSDERLADLVVEALLNNETFFFRDRQSFELLLGPAVRRLEQSRRRTRRLSIWCAGCSTGQEAYSVAMHFAEQKARWGGWTIEILGTDVSRSAVEQARSGIYSQFEVQRGLAVVQMMRWFEELPGAAWRISPDLRRAVRFEVGSLVGQSPPGGPFDIILCRNVLLYFSPEMRRLAFGRLAAAAAEDSALMLGAGETVIGQTDAFVSDPECRGLYQRVPEKTERRRAAS